MTDKWPLDRRTNKVDAVHSVVDKIALDKTKATYDTPLRVNIPSLRSTVSSKATHPKKISNSCRPSLQLSQRDPNIATNNLTQLRFKFIYVANYEWWVVNELYNPQFYYL